MRKNICFLILIIGLSLVGCSSITTNNANNKSSSSNHTDKDVQPDHPVQSTVNIFSESGSKDITYKEYQNGRFGFSIDYPSTFITKLVPTNNDGIILVSPDGSVELTVSGINNVFNKTVNSYYNEFLSEQKNISYKKLQGSWFIASWTEGEDILYTKEVVGTGSVNTFIIKYPILKKEYYDPVISRLLGSFKTPGISEAHEMVLNETPNDFIADFSDVQPEYQKYAKVLNINENVLEFIKDDIDLDGNQEVIIVFGDKDSDSLSAFVLREGNDKLEDLGQLKGSGYGIYNVDLVQMQGKKQKYIELQVTNGGGLSGFGLYMVEKNSINQVAYSASPTGSGDDALTSSNKNEIYDGYVQNRSSYDVMYFSVTRYYKWNGQSFDFVSSKVDTGDYPNKPEDVVTEFLKLNLLSEADRNSNEVASRLNEINISDKILSPKKIQENLESNPYDNFRDAARTDNIQLNTLSDEKSATVKVSSKDVKITFKLIKNDKWQINDFDGDFALQKG